MPKNNTVIKSAPLLNYLFYRFQWSLIRRFAILCCINWGIVLTGNALIRRGVSCLLNVGRVVLGRVFFGASCLELSLGQVVLFPTKHVSLSSLGFTKKKHSLKS